MKKGLLGMILLIITIILVSCTSSVIECEDGFELNEAGTMCYEIADDNTDDVVDDNTDNNTDDPVDCNMTPDDPECEDEVIDDSICQGAVGCVEQLEILIASLTIEEKAAQMVQAERGYISPAQVEQYGIGSILSGGGSHPNGYESTILEWETMVNDYQAAALNSSSGIPLIYGIDAVHGNNNLYGATIFPHNINLGAANNPDLVYDISYATAMEMKAIGVHWNFAPALSVVQNISWGRTYEGWSESPDIHENLTIPAIEGLQDADVIATAKHFFGDGGTTNGDDQGNSVMLDDAIKDLHLLPYIEAIEAGALSVMISYSSVNNVKMHMSEYWITDILKEAYGFEGFVISDWQAIHQLPGDFEDQVTLSINAGVDMLMEPSQWEVTIQTILDAHSKGRITDERIDDAVRRIVYAKYHAGVMDNPYYDADPSVVYSEEHAALARQAVRESLVLLKNENNSLPLSSNSSIYLTGPAADNVGYMSGGWTRFWQGTDAQDMGVGASVKTALEGYLSVNLESSYQDADTVIIVLTELPYAEGNGDNLNPTLTSATAHPANAAALEEARLAHLAGKNVVGILFSGRPMLLEGYLEYFDSFIAAFLPGTEGGNGMIDVLSGAYDFVGKLPYTWPRTSDQIGVTVNDDDYLSQDVLFRFGYGLTYAETNVFIPSVTNNLVFDKRYY